LTHHVERLEHLTLVRCTITVHRKRAVLLALVLLRERRTRADRDLGTDDTVSTKEGRSEDVHGATLALGHASLATEELGEDSRDGAATKDSEGVAAVASDDTVVLLDTVLHTDRDSLLH